MSHVSNDTNPIKYHNEHGGYPMLHCNQSSAVIFARCDSLHILHSSVALPTHVFVCAGVTGAQATRKRTSGHVPMIDRLTEPPDNSNKTYLCRRAQRMRQSECACTWHRPASTEHCVYLQLSSGCMPAAGFLLLCTVSSHAAS